MKSNEDSAPSGTKTYLIAQDFIAHGIHYYAVEAETMGEALYVWKCATCHDPRGQRPIVNRAEGWVGPWVDANTVSDLGEDGMRDMINIGTARMPGWQYTLSEEQVDQIIAYLKTVTSTR